MTHAERLQTELKTALFERNTAREQASILEKNLGSISKKHGGNHVLVHQSAISETEIKIEDSIEKTGDVFTVYKVVPNAGAGDTQFANPEHLRNNRLAKSTQHTTKDEDIPDIDMQGQFSSKYLLHDDRFGCKT